MSHHSTVPEYTLEQPLERMHLSSHLSRDTKLILLAQVVEKLKQLSEELSMLTDISNEIHTRLGTVVLQLEEL